MSAARVSRPEVRELRQQLTGRDMAIIWQIGELRLMSGRQIEAIHFSPEMHATAATAARHCRRVLARLERDALLVRLDRRVGGLRAGSQTFIYGLGPIGHRLLRDDGSRLRLDAPSQVFVDHQLAVSQLVVDGILASRQTPLELLMVQGEPACWRAVPGFGRVILRPDLFLAIGADDLEYRWFVEIDRNTHHAPSLLRKARLYESYYRSGVEQAKHDVFPRVIWITPDESRAEAVRKVLSRREFTPALMLAVTTQDALRIIAGGTT